jgi:hypothetical protein
VLGTYRDLLAVEGEPALAGHHAAKYTPDQHISNQNVAQAYDMWRRLGNMGGCTVSLHSNSGNSVLARAS